MIGFYEDIALNHGGRVSEKSLLKGARVPCASVLVRLTAGRVVGPAPAYSSREYDTSRCMPAPHEVMLYRQRLRRPPLPALAALKREAPPARLHPGPRHRVQARTGCRALSARLPCPAGGRARRHRLDAAGG